MTMASTTSSFRVNVFDGARQPFAADFKPLITITSGFHKQLVRDNYPAGQTFDLPFYDNLGDNYTVLAYADNYSQAGFTPVVCSTQYVQRLDIMLLKKNASFNFAAAGWGALKQSNPLLSAILAHGATDDAAASNRYAELMRARPEALACLLNITTAMEIGRASCRE